MDSQENTLNQGTIEEPQVEATVAETPAVENTSEAETKTYATKQEVLDRVTVSYTHLTLPTTVPV